jgi:hypothetical protein
MDAIKEGDQYRVHVRWRSTNGQLTVEDACVQDVQGLNDLKKRLLKQRGATGEPSDRLRETSKKVMSMVSVVSNLKSSSNKDVELPPTSSATQLMRDSRQQTEQAMDAKTLDN